ncbi:MAG: hypothetical protein AVDCRST_MAG25-3698 [uncultured Rubrobacteraceae bacterium]|uniref:HEPN domain-containing protein n=1 Tax=uncultured Rubrobacteraceae bacterium TaxID=349277 RepID=A0A6J4SFI8_9ACTN|nr:MAG: hypothetical protein AVDCRST_MAG25-3698 [uncultured Rubrobacteraceae bacterium]
MSEVYALLDKAARSFDASEMLLNSGDVDFAASRSYYGYFYVAGALLLHEGHSFSRHGQVIAQYGRIFAKTDRMERRFHRAFMQAFSIRTAADYSTSPGLEAETVGDWTREGRAFQEAALRYLAQTEVEDTAP